MKQIQKLALNIIDNLSKQENFEEKLEILTVTSSQVDKNISKIIDKAVEKAETDEDINKVKQILKTAKVQYQIKLLIQQITILQIKRFLKLLLILFRIILKKLLK